MSSNGVRDRVVHDDLARMILLTAGLGTLTIATNFLDPINLPKLVGIVLPLPWIVLNLLRITDAYSNWKNLFEDFGRVIFIISIGALFLLLLTSSAPMERRILGTWGRNNGLLTALISVLVAWATFEYVKKTAKLSTLISGTVFILVPTAIYGLVQVLGQDPIAWSSGTMKIFGTFGNTNFASAAWALGAISSMTMFIFSQNKEKHKFSGLGLFYFVNIFVFTYLSFMTKSIQGLFAIGTFVSILIFASLWSRKSAIYKIGALLLALLASIVAQSIFFTGPLTSLISTAGSLGFRKIYWNIGLRMFGENPIFGVGVDSFGDFYRSVRTPEMATTTSIDLVVNNAHNTFIQTISTMGLLGFVAMVLPVLITLILGLRRLFNAKTGLDTAVFAIFVSLWLMAAFSIDNISITIWNWLFLGASLGLAQPKNQIVQETNERRRNSKKVKTRQLYDFGRIIAASTSIVLFFFMWISSSADRNIVSTLRIPASFSQPETINARLISLGEVSRLKVLDPQHYLMLARALVELQQVPQSVEVLSKGVSSYPRDFALWDSLAYSLENQGRIPEAIEARKKQLELDPRHARIWSYLAQDLVKNNQLDEAKKAAQSSLENFSIFAPGDQESIRNLLIQLNLI